MLENLLNFYHLSQIFCRKKSLIFDVLHILKCLKSARDIRKIAHSFFFPSLKKQTKKAEESAKMLSFVQVATFYFPLAYEGRAYQC